MIEGEERTKAYKRFAQTDDGKIILKDLASLCNYNKTSVDHEPDAYRTFFAEGKRWVFLRIKSFIEREH